MAKKLAMLQTNIIQILYKYYMNICKFYNKLYYYNLAQLAHYDINIYF